LIALDTNLLVHAHRRDAPFHAAASTCVVRLAEGNTPWAIPWPCVHEFLAVVTHPRIFRPPTPLDEALGQIDAWLESPNVVLLSETSEHWTCLRSLLHDSRVAGPVVHDARVAALCLQHGVRELWTADRDFGRFPALRCVNPLIGG
jgi:hypothetical protein